MVTRSPTSPPKVFLVERLVAWAEDEIRRRAELHHFSDVDEETLVAEASDADAIVIGGRGRLTRRVFTAARNLRVVGRHGVGVDHIDLVAAAEHGITVVNTPLANARSVAEFTVALMLAGARHIVAADAWVREERGWDEPHRHVGVELFGKTLGLVGMGKIGRLVAQICAAGFGMRIRYFDYRRRHWDHPPTIEAIPSSLEEVLELSDIVSLHVPLIPETRHLIDRRRLALMPPTALLINTARGAIVDEIALIDALQQRRLAGAALDVMEVEPLCRSPLQQLSNVVLTSHIGSHTREAFRAMAEIVLDVLAVLEGEPPKNRVGVFRGICG